MNKRTRKRAERVAAVIEKIMADSQAKFADISDGKEFADCRVTVNDSPGRDTDGKRFKSGFVRLTYDGAGFDFWSYDAEFKFGMRDELSEALKKIDKDLYFEDCNCWSLEIWIDPR